ESEYPMMPEKTLVPAMAMAPRPEDWVRYASYWAQEVQHATYWIKMLAELGIDAMSKEFMSQPKPIYIFNMRDDADSWAEWAYFSYFADRQDRKSTRLNSSHRTISYAVFCLKKKTSLPGN